jgi:hypothetical protein
MLLACFSVAHSYSQESGSGSSLHAAVLLLTSLSVPDKLLLQTAAQPWLASKVLDLEIVCSHCIAQLKGVALGCQKLRERRGQVKQNKGFDTQQGTTCAPARLNLCFHYCI